MDAGRRLLANGLSRCDRASDPDFGDPESDSNDFDLGELASLIEHSPDRPVDRRLTEKEVERALAALQRAHDNNHKLSARYGGKPFPCSVAIIHEMREERIRQLMGDADPIETATARDESSEPL
ncbi:MAG: hypothetical protein M3464_10720 [Chloroflexota bacterium]|nr:hypothetical protein [Chloroflexota bacterium]